MSILEILEFLAFREKLENNNFFAGQRKAQVERARVILVFLDFRENQNILKKGVSFLAPKEFNAYRQPIYVSLKAT
jgi:hypothetical protein